jgi:hypothetical protein
MDITRRAFFSYSKRSVRDDPEKAGERLRNVVKKGIALPGSGEKETASEEKLPASSSNVGLRNARATIRRNTNELC